MKSKRLICLFSLVVILAFGIYAMSYTYREVDPTYDGTDVDVTQLYADPGTYDVSDPEGVSDIIVKTNLEKTMAVNNVAAVVFDYRGFDTIGESFILLTAIAGSFVIVSKVHKSGKGGEKE
ncbi:MAG: hypothetical protein IJ466_05720 [Clostridia bacterium]|nr:hypothetical protein [Clostridia bacterium]